MARSSRQEDATAYHEAGHAVVGLWEQVPSRLIQVSIVPDAEAGTLGHVRRGKSPRVLDYELGPDRTVRRIYREFNPEFDDERLIRRRLTPEVVTLFAGVLAEKRFIGRRHNWLGATSDLRLAADLVSYMDKSPRRERKYTDYLWVVAEETVDRFWQDVEALAQELLTRKTMTRLEVIAFQRAALLPGRRVTGA